MDRTGRGPGGHHIVALTLMCALALMLIVFHLLLGPAGEALAASIVVTDSGDSGPGTLRDAIDKANLNPGPDIITFSSDMTIQPLSGYQITDDSTTVDAEENLVVIDGQLLAGENCFTVTSDGNTFDGLRIVNTTVGGLLLYCAILMCSSDNNTIRGC